MLFFSGRLFRCQLAPRLPPAGGVVTDPAGVAPDRYIYYPGTEALDKDEIRVTACDTGMPAARHGQAATCSLMEFGTDENLLFDVGTDSVANIAAYMTLCSQSSPSAVFGKLSAWKSSKSHVSIRTHQRRLKQTQSHKDCFVAAQFVVIVWCQQSCCGPVANFGHSVQHC